MSFVKWLRKNNKKIMAVVVIVLMIGFVGGSYIQQFARRSGRPGATIAYYGQKSKISQADLFSAQNELEILKIIRADAVLGTQDLRGVLLGELIFPERGISAEMVGLIEEIIRRGDYGISKKQVNDIFRPKLPTSVYWMLLQKEAQQAGFRVSKEEAGRVLAMTTPKLFNGASYQQLVASLMDRQGISENEILSAFSSFLAVVQYTRSTCADENLTSSQIMHDVSLDEETMNVDFVRFDSASFVKNIAEPAPQQIEEQFNKYKAFFAGEVNDLNPYGFGYKLPAMVQLEYLAVKFTDVEQIVTAPSNQEMEDYYRRNIEDFTMSYRSDPNDPNSPIIKKPRSFGEVAGIITRLLTREKLTTKAEDILHQAKELIESNLQTAEVEVEKLTGEQLKQLSGDYEAAAKQIGEKNKIKIYSGKTGLLSATDMQSDAYLRTAFISSFKANPVPLINVVFAADELDASELGPFDPPKPKLYEDIGSVQSMAEKVMFLVRVIEAKKPSVPETIDLTFGTAGMKINSDANKPDKEIYSVRGNVTDDLKNLAAMDVAKAKVREFINLAQKQGWSSATAEFNKLYPSSADEPNAFKLQSLTDVQRLSKAMLSALAAQNAGDPMGRTILYQAKQQHLLLEQLYSLIPSDSNVPPELPAVLDFKPNLSVYCIKDVSVKRINTSEYERLKAQTALKEDFAQSQVMAAVFFNPENIAKRMNFRWTQKEIMPFAPETTLPPEGDF